MRALLIGSAVLLTVLLSGTSLATTVAPELRPTLTHAEGTQPAEQSSYGCHPGRDEAPPRCPREVDYRWELPRQGSVRTTWLTSRSDTNRLHGALSVDLRDCRDAVLSWTLTAGGHSSSGVLSAAGSGTLVQPALHGPQERITLELRRTDAGTCAAGAVWSLARADAPWLGFLWSWL
ncbi:hypothetical protein JOF53_001612 [Crossiella equi]|uniref:Secreted protein n=1 Tax=Crossiella equi TaxID=130796 RepID=A0ABS5A826_9PSEU|nr:hypothetical protein [Crossiella equi]MBP2472740.1 hypothetical protein [Crossiella equi]